MEGDRVYENRVGKIVQEKKESKSEFMRCSELPLHFQSTLIFSQDVSANSMIIILALRLAISFS